MTDAPFILPNGTRRAFIDRIFKNLTVSGLILSLLFLLILVGRMVAEGAPAFYAHSVQVNIDYAPEKIGLTDTKSDKNVLRQASYSPLWQDALLKLAPGAEKPDQIRAVFRLVSRDSSFILRDKVVADPQTLGTEQNVTLPLSAKADDFLKALKRQVTFIEGDFSFTGEADKNTYRLTPKTDALFTQQTAFTADDPSLILKFSGAYFKVKALETKANQEKTLRVEPLLGNIKDRDFNEILKAPAQAVILNIPENQRAINDFSAVTLLKQKEAGLISAHFNTSFFVNGDSREPETAGIAGAFIGSLLTIAVCFAFALPIGAAAAVYLQEFAPKNGLTDFLEMNINNLASVPSIIYGLLGLAVFINVFGAPRSSPLAGGAVLALMSLPVIIIAARSALRSVPQSLRDAAIALGASPLQTFFHHTLPCAVPGIVTGSVLALARALGETAPLLLIGMVAFIPDIPTGITEEAAVLPVQIFLWADSPEQSYQQKTAAAVLILLAVMISISVVAIKIRKKFEIRY